MIRVGLEHARSLGALIVDDASTVPASDFYSAALVVDRRTGVVLKDRFGVLTPSDVVGPVVVAAEPCWSPYP